MMRLISATISGFRRFAEDVTVRLSEPLIALVGPNEAGKSSFLEALRKFEEEGPISEGDATRRSGLSPMVAVTFELDDDDHAALEPLEFAAKIRFCSFKKDKSGAVHITLSPDPPHDFGPRRAAAAALNDLPPALLKSGAPASEHKKRDALVRTVTAIMESEDGCLSGGKLGKVGELTKIIAALSKNQKQPERRNSLDAAAKALNVVIKYEKSCPRAKAWEVLTQRRPRFILFDEPARELPSTHDLVKTAMIPPALSNLARLAGLDLRTLRDAMRKDDKALRKAMVEAANDVLKEEFSKAWVRSDVVPSLDADGSVLALFVSMPDQHGYTVIDERSDGLRWFVALRAFLALKQGSTNPILLVDEAERHLSYDAQANLIGVLESQDAVPTIIYTTHSAGCLPSDLGTGVRPVIPLEGERSEIRNAFWTKGPGFSPLLLAMGLGPLAFTPFRNVLIGEGPSECLLLPSLFRQAVGQRQLPFQVAPGGANAGPVGFPELLVEGGKVAFLFDGDDAGQNLRKQAVEGGANPDRVRLLSDFFDHEPLVFEDLIDPDSYVWAFNEEMAWQDANERVEAEELPAVGRAGAVDLWCDQRDLNRVRKASLCQLLALKAADGTSIVSAERMDGIKKLYHWLHGCFALVSGEGGGAKAPVAHRPPA